MESLPSLYYSMTPEVNIDILYKENFKLLLFRFIVLNYFDPHPLTHKQYNKRYVKRLVLYKMHLYLLVVEVEREQTKEDENKFRVYIKREHL